MKIATIKKMATGLACGALAFGFAITPTAANAELLSFEANSHHDGNQANDNNTNTWYGLRLDDPGTSATNTFRFNEASGDPMVLGASTVSAFIDTNTGLMTLLGTVYHVQDSDSRYQLAAVIQLENAPFTQMTIDDLKLNLVNGVIEGSTTSLVLTPLDGGDFMPLNWIGHPMNASDDHDIHLGNNHRSTNELEAWGWLEPQNQQLAHTDSQDWLFTMEYDPTIPPPNVPEPATVALMGLGLAGLAARRARKQS